MGRNHRFGPRRLVACIATLIAVVAAMAVTAPAASAHDAVDKAASPSAPMPTDQPRRGLVFGGLRRARPVNGCHGNGMFVTRTKGQCTHGPDAAPANVDVHTSAAPAAGAFATPSFRCDGDGSTGYRVQVLYVHASDVTDRFADYLSSFRQWTADMDHVYSDSAAETGGSRRLRFVQDPSSCIPTITDVTVPPDGDDSFDTTISAVAAQGYDRTDRKYVMFVDASIYCGIGTFVGDDTPGATNSNNYGPSYGRSDNGCWSESTLAHELGHNLGAVQLTAPHTSGGAHCVDEYDVMCYSDTPNFPVMQYLCPDPAHDLRLDCNHDDYYNTDPVAGSYLAAHWNVADSAFLVGGPIGSIAGTVRRVDGSPVAGARVVVDGLPMLSGVTGTGGAYSIPNVPNGNYRISAGPCLVTGRSVVVSGATTANLVAGGPSDTRYRCDAAPAGWISATSTLALTGDDAIQTVTLPFPVELYGQREQSLTVSTNGFAALGDGTVDPSYGNDAVPSPMPPNGAFYPFWDDLQVDGGASVRTATTGSSPNRQFVVEWRNVRFFSTDTERLSFELVLGESGSIAFNYRDVDLDALELGQQATIGIEDATGSNALMVSNNQTALTQDGSLTFADARPTLSIGDAAVQEGTDRTRSMRFNVALSAPAPTDVTAAWATAPGTASANSDFTTASGTVRIPAGSASATVSVPVRGDTLPEQKESFAVSLTRITGAAPGRTNGAGRILDDDPSTGVRVAIGDASVVEGQHGSRTLRFTVTLSTAAANDVTVDVATADGTARAGSDYRAVHGSVTIVSGQTSTTIAVPITPDRTHEGDETFAVRLADAQRATLGRTTGAGRIIDDD